MQSVVIFQVDTPERRALKEAYQLQAQGLRRCVVLGEKAHSQSGTLLLLGEQLVGWTSRHQDVVALSITEAEYISNCEEAKVLLWVKQFLEANQPTGATDPPDGQQGSSLPHQNNEVPETVTPYRTPFPLSPTTSEEREPLCQNDTRNREPSRPANETPTSTENNGLDDEIDWWARDDMIDFLMTVQQRRVLDFLSVDE